MAAEPEAQVSDLIQDILSLGSIQKVFDHRQSVVLLINI